jgi:hypothetical protein
MAEDTKDEWDAYWEEAEQSAAEETAEEPSSEDTMLTEPLVEEPRTEADTEVGDTLSSLSSLPAEKKKKTVQVSKFRAWKIGISNIIYEETDDAEMLRLKEAHKRLQIAFRVLVGVSLLVLIIALWSIAPESMSVVVFLMLTILTLGLLFAIGGTDAIIDLAYAGEILGRWAMLYLILGTLVLIAVTVVLGINLYKNEVAIYSRYDKIVLKNKTRVYSKPE